MATGAQIRPASSVEALGRAVLGMLDERGLERVSYCGLSLGSAVGAWLAINAPERIERLVLACTATRFGTREGWLARAATVRADGVEAIADAVLQLWFTPDTHAHEPDLVRSYRAMMVSAEREGYVGCCEALAAWDPGEALGAIAAPTLVLAGSEDTATPPRGARRSHGASRARACASWPAPGTWPTSSSHAPSTGSCSSI